MYLEFLLEAEYKIIPPTSADRIPVCRKIINEKYILGVGLELSSSFKGNFTCSFFLSESFVFAYMLPGFPQEAYMRIGNLLTPEERRKHLSNEFNQPNVVDAWWEGFTEENMKSMVYCVKACEGRFINQKHLYKKISECQEMKAHSEITEKVCKLALDDKELPVVKLTQQPKKRCKEIPEIFYEYAEVVLLKHEPEIINSRFVSLVAIDAWRKANFL